MESKSAVQIMPCAKCGSVPKLKARMMWVNCKQPAEHLGWFIKCSAQCGNTVMVGAQEEKEVCIELWNKAQIKYRRG